MAISTQTEALLDLYNQKVSLDTQQLSQINVVQNGYTIQTGVGSTEKIKIWGPNEIIENYNVPIEKLDNRIVEINQQIIALEQQVLSIGEEANAVGCGSTAFSLFYPSITVYEDQLKYKGYTYTAPNPFSETNGNLTTGNLGIGTYTYVNPVAIGSYFGPVDTCSLFGQIFLGCDNEVCAGYGASITTLNNQIVGLQSSRNALMQKVNLLKSGRSTYELQNYAYNQSIVQTNQSISNSNIIINFLEDPQNAEWL